MNTVIFACLHNAGRSQMAAAFFNQRAGPREGAGDFGRHSPRSTGAPRSARCDERGWHRLVGS